MTMHWTLRGTARLGAVLILLAWRPAAPVPVVPTPPCRGQTAVYPALGEPAIEMFWRPADAGDWRPPPCVGWTNPRFATMVTTAARFRFTGSTDDLLIRIGAVSELKGVRYWSPSRNAWQTLIVDAAALDGPKGHSRRADFSADELRDGAVVYFQQTDNLLGKAIFRLTIMEATPDRIVFSVENAEALRYSFVTLIRADEMQSVHFLIRESASVWRYYGMVRMGEHTNHLVTAHPSSSVNRAVAFFRHYAGIPTDQEPPGAR